MAPESRPAAALRTRLVYILAASHSGSTLLTLLLARHPQICTVGEMQAGSLGELGSYRCACGVPIRQCGFWQALSAHMGRRGVPFELASPSTDVRAIDSEYVRRLLRPLCRSGPLEVARGAALALSARWRQGLPRVQAANAALAASLVELTGRSVVVDSSKIGIRLKYLLRNQALDVKVIRLVRDGRAVALTYMDPAEYADARSPVLRGGGSGAMRAGERLPAALAAREWRRSNEEAEHLLRGLPPDRWIEVRYEALCKETASTVAATLAFLGLEPGAPMQEPPEGLHVVGNGMRLDWNAEVRLDERWRAALGPSERRTFDAVAGDVNRRYGYV